MLVKLFLFFTIIPIVELYLLIKVGGKIGAFNTIIIILLTALLGAFLAKREGFNVIRDIKNAVSQQRMPARELLNGLLVLMGGFALLTPGFLSDVIGITMLFPFTRQLYSLLIIRIINNKIRTGIWKLFS